MHAAFPPTAMERSGYEARKGLDMRLGEVWV